MAKQSGLAQTTLSVDNSSGSAKAIINDVTNWQLSTPRAIQDVTGVDKSAMERIHLLADFSITLNGVFNTTADASHDVFTPLDTARTVTIVQSSQTLNNETLFTDYQLTRADSGALTWQANGVLSDGTVPVWT
jgi:hypothetical protein